MDVARHENQQGGHVSLAAEAQGQATAEEITSPPSLWRSINTTAITIDGHPEGIHPEGIHSNDWIEINNDVQAQLTSELMAAKAAGQAMCEQISTKFQTKVCTKLLAIFCNI